MAAEAINPRQPRAADARRCSLIASRSSIPPRRRRRRWRSRTRECAGRGGRLRAEPSRVPSSRVPDGGFPRPDPLMPPLPRNVSPLVPAKCQTVEHESS
ncbi:hypothetical protein NL676_020082 [Syzygium grande]|nr:hypothetical protein NL676_020082 [Syzygium grande]